MTTNRQEYESQLPWISIAPDPIPTIPFVFLAGAITGAPDWQAEATEFLKNYWAIADPRRIHGLEKTGEAARVQIAWEREALCKAKLILFWFPAATIAPIALFELGCWASSSKDILVAAHPNYERRFDIIEQMRWIRPGLFVESSLTDILIKARLWNLGD